MPYKCYGSLGKEFFKKGVYNVVNGGPDLRTLWKGWWADYTKDLVAPPLIAKKVELARLEDLEKITKADAQLVIDYEPNSVGAIILKQYMFEKADLEINPAFSKQLLEKLYEFDVQVPQERASSLVEMSARLEGTSIEKLAAAEAIKREHIVLAEGLYLHKSKGISHTLPSVENQVEFDQSVKRECFGVVVPPEAPVTGIVTAPEVQAGDGSLCREPSYFVMPQKPIGGLTQLKTSFLQNFTTPKVPSGIQQIIKNSQQDLSSVSVLEVVDLTPSTY